MSANLGVHGELLRATPLDDSPLDLRGAVKFVTGAGRMLDRTCVRLCRCGRSGDKPFCDGSHRAAGFRADGRGVKLTVPGLAATRRAPGPAQRH